MIAKVLLEHFRNWKCIKKDIEISLLSEYARKKVSIINLKAIENANIDILRRKHYKH